MKLSILIPTITERELSFKFIKNKLEQQINSLNSECKVEILSICDNRELTIGEKRNMLIKNAKGKYVCFIDDDDDVSGQYVKLILDAIRSDVDCVGMNGIITFDGSNPTIFTHSIKHNEYSFKNGIYLRPPNHLNPIKRSIAIKFLFPEKDFGEDTDWAMQICKNGVLKTEIFIERPIYFYKYISDK